VLPQHVEGLRRRDFMYEMQSDEQLGLSAWQLSHAVHVPNFTKQSF
jgi:hypothetical protein